MIGLRSLDDLAVERDEQAQHPVGGRVVRAHVQRQELLVAGARR